MYFVLLFSIDNVTTRTFIHPEVIDKYPGYLKFTGYAHEIGKPFDPNNGEACVPQPLYANKCDSKTIAGSRTRNLNYFFDYLDAQFSKSVNFKYGSITHLIASFGCVVFVFLALLLLTKNNYCAALFFSTSFLCLPQLLALNSTLYRSGKILTCLFLSLLFYIYIKIRSDVPLSINTIALSFIASSLLILSDEQAIIIFLIFMALILLKRKFNLLLIYSLIIVWYFIFRFLIEPFMASHLNGITILRTGTYADPTTFLKFDLSILGSTLSASGYQIFMSLGATNFIGCLLTSIVVTCLIVLMVFLFVKPNEWCDETRKKFFHYVRMISFLSLIWLLTIYLMALRHDFIVRPPLFGGGYYFVVSATFFYFITVAGLVQISPSLALITPFIAVSTSKRLNTEVSKDLIRNWAVRAEGLILEVSVQKIIIILVVLMVSSNFINTRQTREQIREGVMGRDWLAQQLQIQEIITTQKQDNEYSIYEPIYLKHKYFIDSYKKNSP